MATKYNTQVLGIQPSTRPTPHASFLLPSTTLYLSPTILFSWLQTSGRFRLQMPKNGRDQPPVVLAMLTAMHDQETVLKSMLILPEIWKHVYRRMCACHVHTQHRNKTINATAHSPFQGPCMHVYSDRNSPLKASMTKNGTGKPLVGMKHLHKKLPPFSLPHSKTEGDAPSSTMSILTEQIAS